MLKTRLMTQGASGRYSSLWNAATTIARTEGMSAFMLGWQPRLIWISLGGFVFFPVLEVRAAPMFETLPCPITQGSSTSSVRCCTRGLCPKFCMVQPEGAWKFWAGAKMISVSRPLVHEVLECGPDLDFLSELGPLAVLNVSWRNAICSCRS